MGADVKGNATCEVELQRLMSNDHHDGDDQWHSSDQDDDSLADPAYFEVERRHQMPAWKRILHSFRRNWSRRRVTEPDDYSEAAKSSKVIPRRRSCVSLILITLLSLILLTAAGLIFNEFADIHTGAYTPPWSDPHWLNSSFTYPSDFTKDVTALPCISHNDESRSVPLFEAIANGCTGVEGDIYLRKGEVLVGHRRLHLSTDRTVSNMYIAPLVQIVTRSEGKSPAEVGVFDKDPTKPVVMMFDFKERDTAEDLFRALEKELEPLRSIQALSHVADGKFVSSAITVVVSGDAPFSMLKQRTNHDIFFDAPLRWIWQDHSSGLALDEQTSKAARAGSGQGYGETSDVVNAREFDSTNSYFASMSFAHSYWPPLWGLNDRQEREITEQVEAAHAQGLKVRYWGTYDWPWTKIRERLWRFFGEAETDIWNVDDLAWFSKGLWKEKKGGK